MELFSPSTCAWVLGGRTQVTGLVWQTPSLSELAHPFPFLSYFDFIFHQYDVIIED